MKKIVIIVSIVVVIAAFVVIVPLLFAPPSTGLGVTRTAVTDVLQAKGFVTTWDEMPDGRQFTITAYPDSWERVLVLGLDDNIEGIVVIQERPVANMQYANANWLLLTGG